ncbi:DEAD/DEAH box helicase [Variovorax ureilyticus]|uniref:DEAD/DEAH box helicase n=1 Tax=Variovorax ureilyticus TaxID=1836198 RepID=A0ABU8VSH1_9BURK
MAAFDQERLELAERLRRSLAIKNRLLPEQARAFVRGLQVTWHVPPIQWRERESDDLLADARRLMHAAEIFREVEGDSSDQAMDCYRRAGELLEWLTRADTQSNDMAPLALLAGAAFQLGGLPAMSTALLGQIKAPEAGIRLFLTFLKGDFNGVIDEVLSFWNEHADMTRRDAPASLLEHEDPERLKWYFTVEIVRSVGLVAATLRQGNRERWELALRKLTALEKLATRSFGDDVSLLITLLTAVAKGYGAASIYGPIAQLSRVNPERAPRLRRFARDQFGRGRGILWPSQARGLDRLLESSSFALCTPTGSGKTLVANLALVKELMLASEDESMGALALYLVPSRALAGEVEAKLVSELGNDLIVTGLYGGTDWGITDYWLNAERPTVLVATVEKADALMRYVGPLIIARLRLLVVDEAHQVVAQDRDRTLLDFAEHSSRALRLEGFVSRLLARVPNIARIALTAVAGGAAGPVARWVEGNADATPIGTNYRSTRQLIGSLECTPGSAGRMQVDMMNGAMLHVRGRDEAVYIPLRIPPMPLLPASMRNSIYRYNEVNVLWTALHLLEADRRILISVAQQPEQTMRWFNEALALPSWADIPKFKVPTDPEARARFEEARLTCVDYCGEDAYEVALLDHGIATSHGQMPQRLRRLMTGLIERRICPITVATATLTEGVNLPFDLIFVPDLTRRVFDNETQRSTVAPMSTAEFRNLAGRAGRPGSASGLEGMTLVALPTAPSATARGQLPQQRRQIRDIRSHYDNLVDALVEEEQSGEDPLCPLALLLETLAERAGTMLGIRGAQFLQWLEETAPDRISATAGTGQTDEQSRLADSLDELDGVLLAAIEELAMGETSGQTGADLEASLRSIWRRSFSHAAAVREAWLEQAFVRRGQGITDAIYRDAEERRRLYQYGFPPHVGRRFEHIAPRMRAVVSAAGNYGSIQGRARLAVFKELGALVASDRGFGFRARATATDQALMQDWEIPLAWWLRTPGSEAPIPSDLRAWQRFVADNFEFRLGVAVGAVVAQAWSAGSNDPSSVPSLEDWRETTGLPWFGFWAREMLRWGTLDPFIAFALAQGLAGTRDRAADRRREFESWMESEYDDIEGEDWIDPRYFLKWERTLESSDQAATAATIRQARLTGTNGVRGTYSVHPIRRPGAVHWIDASGFELATTAEEPVTRRGYQDDFQLEASDGLWKVRRVFRSV